MSDKTMSDKAGENVKPRILGEKPDNYAGDVSAEEAWRVLSENPGAVLVDVRTRAEWNFVGLADLGPLGKEALLAEWQSFPTMGVNPAFVDEVGAALKGASRDVPVLFLCRSGARSRAAAVAMTKAGFSQAYNVAGGFEGDLDETRHRGRRNGWKASGLPWIQS
jgi:rhodanese-related sulfurtransferase